MPNMELITSVTVGSGGTASVTLPATGTIPQTYTDLKVVISSRNTDIYNEIHFRFNGDTGNNYSGRNIYGNGSTVTSSFSSSISSLQNLTVESVSGQTASTFGNTELYIPNYTSSNHKSISADGVQENNATSAQAMLGAGLWANTAAITTITAFPSIGTFAEGSTFYLYGISNVTSGSKATGGIVSSDGTYWYHMFPYSGTFTPTSAISADVLMIAGGGGANNNRAAGAGAGGLITATSKSLTATSYTITIGAGGPSTVGYAASGSIIGSNTTAFSYTANGGGGGDGTQSMSSTGYSGGSGGGGTGSGSSGGPSVGGSATQTSPSGATGYGNNGGAGHNNHGGGGGGAGGTGGVSTTSQAGNGGIGLTNSLLNAMGAATQTGQSSSGNYYYAGGGGGGAGDTAVGLGGLGGGGKGSGGLTSTATPGENGLINTGGGGGGGSDFGTSWGNGAAGGSGLVIIRYAI